MILRMQGFSASSTKSHLNYGVQSWLCRYVDNTCCGLWVEACLTFLFRFVQLLSHRVRGADSKFSTYIKYLPIGVSGVPQFFPKAAVDMIEYPPVSEQVKKRGRWMYEFSRDVLGPLPGTETDPFDGIQVDINALGELITACRICMIFHEPVLLLWYSRSCSSAYW